MKKITLIFLIFSGILQAQQKPNIIFILTDDQSYDLLGCTGNAIVQTPHIDKLANNGTLFTNAHVTSAICTPSRISILLSQYERKHGVNFNSGTSVSDTAWKNSYPVVMRNNGYYTGWIGKNHAPIGKGGYNSGLMEKSFDYWYAGHGHLGFYPKDNHNIFNDAIAFTQPEIINEGVDEFLDPNARKLKGALHFLEERPSDKPFMLSINFNLPHGASTRTMKQKDSDDTIYKTLYRDLEIPLHKNYIAKADIKTPKLPENLLHTEDRQTGYNYVDTPKDLKERYIRELQAMTGIDRLIGNLTAKLKALKLHKNTIIIFTSDHGLFGGQQGLGGKALCYEQTTHVPIIIFNPNTPKKNRGKKSDALVQTIDIAPTMLEMAGIKKPSSFQGKNISNLANGGKKEVRDYVFTENLWSTHFGNPRCESVQNKDWKYIRYYKNNNFSATKEIKYAKELGIPVNEMLYNMHDPGIAVYRDYIDAPLNNEQPVYEELYHLKKDPAELHNLVNNQEHAEVLNTLRAQWKIEITQARGTRKAEVFRYTNDLYPKGKH
ncbi:sulfatase-like hydrolase/transferase [Algibacter amylolyticus]|uniref:Sulfatase-like hydrolase/transferase n=1 Tax=Algibacter amylolyticus TaxID=1608400 RepID=A0A5M7B4U6_9FLAO|nr:sulfatase-like hydrolase/transferase [Algibacter amylolyticus]KAA5823770.1 sulfatase-like hydrolase/transferase [Algibacter amylolyticus]MBB5267943.1 arylsulfatase A-like enzyme [Algibacter amylolyticus]TSJ74258.1 sulfatase-like hydrolase/transferase [Algibacter amylolyticus]